MIGIHKQGIINKKINAGTFLGIIDELNKPDSNGTFNIIDKMNIKMMQMKKSICRIKIMNKYMNK